MNWTPLLPQQTVIMTESNLSAEIVEFLFVEVANQWKQLWDNVAGNFSEILDSLRLKEFYRNILSKSQILTFKKIMISSSL